MVSKLRQANMLKAHALGITWAEVGEAYGMSRAVAYMAAHPEKLKNSFRRTTLGTCKDGKFIRLTGLHKRPYTGMCETCGSIISKRLAYHHWLKDNPSLGVWLCYRCHITAELIDDIPDFVQRYEEVKSIASEEASHQVPGNFVYNCQMNFWSLMDRLIQAADDPVGHSGHKEQLVVQYSFTHIEPVAQYV